jgi:hypothetical protein
MLGLVVVEGDAEVGQEAEDPFALLVEAVEEGGGAWACCRRAARDRRGDRRGRPRRSSDAGSDDRIPDRGCGVRRRSQQLPPKFLLNILVELKQAGILRSHRGAEGGFLLARDPAEITIADIVRATDGPLARVDSRLPDQLEYPGSAAGAARGLGGGSGVGIPKWLKCSDAGTLHREPCRRGRQVALIASAN